ncbi:MAG: YihY/virulence factor BrkB family protein [Rickettsiales bacterium]|nr:YihY/virulence factor BrkB family protein [Rickettsiales bacterium]
MLTRIPKALAKATEHTVITHDGIEHAGYLSFMGLLSLFPFLVFLVALAGVFGDGALGRDFILLIRDTLPADAVAALLPRIDEIVDGPPRGLLTISMLAALWTASSAVEGYRTVLNRAYRVGTPPAYVWRRLWSIGQLLIFTALIMLGMGAMFVAPSVIGWAEGMTGVGIYENLGHNLQFYSGVMMLFLVMLAYHSLPNIKQNLAAVLPGALLTILLWTLAVKGLRLYLSSFDQVTLIYGSLGGVIAALLFFYIINVIFIFGAEFNYQLLKAAGSHVEKKRSNSRRRGTRF